MAWFKVDDGFHSSRKLKSITPRNRIAAAGLWAIAGSWCSQEKTDGHVPTYMIKEWGATPKMVESLVSAGLWKLESDGYSFHSWLEFNPSKDRVEAEREASKARMQASRDKKRGVNAGRGATGSDVAPQHSNGDAAPRPDPTRPDPISTYVDISSHVGNADDPEELPRGPAVPVDGWTIVRRVVPSEHSLATKTALSIEVASLLKQGTSEADVVAALHIWLGKSGIGPRVLPHLLSDVIRDRTAPPASSRISMSTADQRVAQAQALKTGNRALSAFPTAQLEIQ